MEHVEDIATSAGSWYEDESTPSQVTSIAEETLKDILREYPIAPFAEASAPDIPSATTTVDEAASAMPFPPPYNQKLLDEFLQQSVVDGQWTRLPGQGVHYAGLFDGQGYFCSHTFDIEYFPMSQTDVLKWCPAKHIWPYCIACGKFYFPATGPNAHANSRKHIRKMQYYA